MKKKYLFFFILLFCSCKEILQKKTNQGIIEYKVEYPDIDSNSFMASMLPDKMVLKFKNSDFKSEMESGMGMFKVFYIVDSNNKIVSQGVKIVTRKIVSQLDSNELIKVLKENFPDYKITITDKKKKIANITCKEAIVKNKKNNEEFKIYFTNKIKLSNPNWFTPYKDIKGVLFDYYIEQYGLKMHFIATNYKETEIADEDFTLPADYKIVSKKAMDKEMKDIFESFYY